MGGENDKLCRLTEGVATSLSAGGLASLWGVDQDTLEAGVMSRTIKAGDANAKVALNAAQVRFGPGTSQMTIYRIPDFCVPVL